MPDYEPNPHEEFTVRLILFADGSPPIIPVPKELWNLIWERTVPLTRFSSAILADFGFMSLGAFAVPEEALNAITTEVSMKEYERRMRETLGPPTPREAKEDHP